MTPPLVFAPLLVWFVGSAVLFMVSNRPHVPGLRGLVQLLRLPGLQRVSTILQFSPTLLPGAGLFFCCMWMT